MSRIPSIQALRALEAFARLGTVWQAADELHVTRSAVSHQLRLLERDLGFALIARSGSRMALTPQGAAYAAEVRRGLLVLAAAGQGQAGRGLGGTLTISVTPGFAAGWLCPRIGRFQAAAPGLALRLVSPRRLDDVSQPGVDAFVAFTRTVPTGMEGTLLHRVAFSPLLVPALAHRLGGLAAPKDLAAAPLLHLQDEGDWRGWFALAGLPEAVPRGIVLPDIHMVLAAALAGQGVFLGDSFTAGEALAAGRLVRPLDLALPSAAAYHLVVPPGHAANPAVAAFRDWLAAEMDGPPAPL